MRRASARTTPNWRGQWQLPWHGGMFTSLPVSGTAYCGCAAHGSCAFTRSTPRSLSRDPHSPLPLIPQSTTLELSTLFISHLLCQPFHPFIHAQPLCAYHSHTVFARAEVGTVMPVTYGFSWITPDPISHDWAYILVSVDSECK
jgi:hypothetical protein